MPHEPNVYYLADQPQLAVLAVVDTALEHAVAALQAAHQNLLVQAWNPDAPQQPRLAAAIVGAAQSLRQLLDEYRVVTECHIADSIPY